MSLSENDKQNKHIRKALEANRKRHSWKKIVSVLSACVLIATSGAMMHRASTMTGENSVLQTLVGEQTMSAGATDGSASVDVSYRNDAEIPEDAQVSVVPVSDAEHDALLNAARAELGLSEDQKIDGQFYDISIHDAAGNEIEPQADVKVKVALDSKKASEAVANDRDVQILHFEDNSAQPSQIQATSQQAKTADTAEVTFSTDSFSTYGFVYTVDFKVEAGSYSMKGGSSIKLSELMQELNVENFDLGSVENVTFDDPSLVKVEKTGSDWTLTSLKPFKTQQQLTVAMKDGRSITVSVTDAQSVDLTPHITGTKFEKKSGDHWDTTSVFNDGDTARFTIYYKIPTGTLKDGDTLTYQVDKDHIVIQGNQSGRVTNDKGEEIGDYTVDTDGKVTIKFDPGVDETKGFEGQISFQGMVSNKNSQDASTVDIDGHGSFIINPPPKDKTIRSLTRLITLHGKDREKNQRQ